MRTKINFILIGIAFMAIIFLGTLGSLVENGTSLNPNGKDLVIQAIVLFISGLSCVKLYRNKTFQKFLKRSPLMDTEKK